MAFIIYLLRSWHVINLVTLRKNTKLFKSKHIVFLNRYIVFRFFLIRHVQLSIWWTLRIYQDRIENHVLFREGINTIWLQKIKCWIICKFEISFSFTFYQHLNFKIEFKSQFLRLRNRENISPASPLFGNTFKKCFSFVEW